MQRKIRFKKCGISNQPDVCIFDDPCLSKFGALRGSCPHPGRQFVGHAPVGLSKRGRDTESDADIQPEEILTFFSNEFPAVFLSEIPQCVFLIILLIPQKRSMLIAAAPSGSFLTVRRSATSPLLFRILQSASAQGTATGRPLFSAFPRSVL